MPQTARNFRDGGRAGSRSASGLARARHSIVMAGGMPREGTVYVPKWVPSALPCEQASRYKCRHAVGKPGNGAASYLPLRSGRQTVGLSLWQGVKLVTLHAVFYSNRQTGKQATRPKCRLPSLSFWTGEVLGRLQAADPRKFFNKDEYLGGMGATTGIRHLTFSQPYA